MSSGSWNTDHISNQTVEIEGEEFQEVQVYDNDIELEVREVQIYSIADHIREAPSADRPQDRVRLLRSSHLCARAPTQNGLPGDRKSLRGATLGLGVLCLLLTAGIVALSVLYTTANNQLQKQSEKLKIKTKECPEGWMHFGSSCYFKFTVKETWSRSRDECGNRQSHLVKIDSREEQEFVAGLNMRDKSWIGLRSTENRTSSTGYKWEWVDDSALTEMFWADGRSDPSTDGFYVTCCDQHGKWIKRKRSDKEERNYICEK